MDIESRAENGIQTIAMAGRLDAATAASLQSCFEELLAPDRARFILDMSGVDYVSSGGLRVLLTMTKKARASSGTVVLAQLHPFVEDLMTMSGFNTVIPTAVTLDEAVRMITEGGRS